jgi:hypothetical protein
VGWLAGWVEAVWVEAVCVADCHGHLIITIDRVGGCVVGWLGG